MQKARSHALNRAPTACKHMVSGSFNSASSGSFHLSIALLCTIGHQRVFSLAGWAPQIQSRFHVTGPTQEQRLNVSDFTYGTVTLCGWTFHAILLSYYVYYSLPYYPRRETPPVWAVSRSLAATEEIDFSFFSSRYLDVSVPCVSLT